jgi:hypothetical protein
MNSAIEITAGRLAIRPGSILIYRRDGSVKVCHGITEAEAELDREEMIEQQRSRDSLSRERPGVCS